MSLLSKILLLVVGVETALAVPTSDVHRTTCHNPRVRKEWRSLKNSEKHEYIRAVNCMWSRPTQGSEYFATKNRWDDFASNHINATTAFANDKANNWVVGPGIHGNGVFLPWHRYFIWIYENVLRDECHYTGTQPYWDWTLDNPTHDNSTFYSDPPGRELDPIFDPLHGFGGNGIAGSLNVTLPADFWGVKGSCIYNGPFANMTINLGPQFNLHNDNPRCIQRNIQAPFANSLLQWDRDVIPLLQAESFANFTQEINFGSNGAFNGVHGVGHWGVGGEMFNIWSSSNDPLFYMHHAQIDRLWALWQSLDPSHLWAFGGSIYANGTGPIDLDYTVAMSPFIGVSRPVRQVMDSVNANGEGVLCYRYQEDGQYVPESLVGNGTAAGK